MGEKAFYFPYMSINSITPFPLFFLTIPQSILLLYQTSFIITINSVGIVGI
jgi:hypothetical protein